MGAAFKVLLKLSPQILSAPLIFSAPTLPPTIQYRSFLASLPRCAFNATFRVRFWPTCDRLPLSCRHPYSLLILCFPLVVFFFQFCLYLLVFFYYLFILFGFFPFLSFIYLYVFSFLSFIVIRLYPLKLFCAYEYIYIWSRPLDCGCE